MQSLHATLLLDLLHGGHDVVGRLNEFEQAVLELSGLRRRQLV